MEQCRALGLPGRRRPGRGARPQTVAAASGRPPHKRLKFYPRRGRSGAHAARACQIKLDRHSQQAEAADQDMEGMVEGLQAEAELMARDVAHDRETEVEQAEDIR